MVNLYVIDESTTGGERLELMMFSEQQYYLPGTQARGDIIMLHNVKARGGSPQGGGHWPPSHGGRQGHSPSFRPLACLPGSDRGNWPPSQHRPS